MSLDFVHVLEIMRNLAMTVQKCGLSFQNTDVFTQLFCMQLQRPNML